MHLKTRFYFDFQLHNNDNGWTMHMSLQLLSWKFVRTTTVLLQYSVSGRGWTRVKSSWYFSHDVRPGGRYSSFQLLHTEGQYIQRLPRRLNGCLWLLCLHHQITSMKTDTCYFRERKTYRIIKPRGKSTTNRSLSMGSVWYTHWLCSWYQVGRNTLWQAANIEKSFHSINFRKQ